MKHIVLSNAEVHHPPESILRLLEIIFVREDSIHLVLRGKDNKTELARIIITGDYSKVFKDFIDGKSTTRQVIPITSGSISLIPVNEAIGHIELDITNAKTGDKEKCTFPIQYKAVKEGKYF